MTVESETSAQSAAVDTGAEPLLKPFHTTNPAPGDAVSAGMKFFAPLFGLLRQLDRTRPVTLVSVHGGPAEWMAMGDVICTNSYNGWYGTSGGLVFTRDRRPKLAAHRLKALWSQPGAGG